VGLAKEFGSPSHLVGRFFGALSPTGPSRLDEEWALSQLLPGEQELWRTMSGPDRRHGVAVAREALTQLDLGGIPADRAVAASALLHDVGKVQAHLGTFERVWVTLAAVLVGRARLVAACGAEGGIWQWRSRLACYLTHDQVGGEMLRQAGSEALTVSWAEQHHLDPSRWSIDRQVARALKDADGD